MQENAFSLKSFLLRENRPKALNPKSKSIEDDHLKHTIQSSYKWKKKTLKILAQIQIKMYCIFIRHMRKTTNIH